MSFINIIGPLFVLCIFSCSYYIYFDFFCLRYVKDLHLKITYLILLHVFAVMLLWSFFATMYSSVGPVPLEYKFSNTDHQHLSRAQTSDERNEILEAFCNIRHLLLYTCTKTGSIRYCYNCIHIKPDRAHHCSACKTCYLKMDHHCPWVGNCIGFLNYKSFLLALLYTSLYGVFIGATTMPLVLLNNIDHLGKSSAISISSIFVIAFMLSIVTFIFFIYHLYLISRNETTLENIYPPNFQELNMSFDLGIRQNFMEVFGDRWYLWLVPVYSSIGCGHLFMINRAN